MNDLIIIGASGFGREVSWLVERINTVQPTWNLLGFLDDNIELHGKNINGYNVLGGCNAVAENTQAKYVCAVGSAAVREKIVEKVASYNSNIQYATLIDPSVPYQDFPQDHAIFAGLYKYAVKNKIKYVLTGANNSTECIRPPVEWVYINDIKFMKDINKRFGNVKLKTFPMCSMFRYRIIYPIFYGMKRVSPLNMVEYDKNKVKEFLEVKYGWEPYENKHYENVFTRFYEGYYLPKKFGYDKRKCYFSNLILTGGMTREEALKELDKPPYPIDMVQDDKEYIAKKLGISTQEFDQIIEGENKTYKDYKNFWGLIRFGTFILRKIGIENKKFR